MAAPAATLTPIASPTTGTVGDPKVTWTEGHLNKTKRIIVTLGVMVYCETCKRVFCDHARRVIADGLDARMETQGVTDVAPLSLPSHVIVPLFVPKGSKKPLAAYVNVSAHSLSDTTFAATIEPPKPTDRFEMLPMLPGMCAGNFLGILNRYEGRRAIRNMLFAWRNTDARCDQCGAHAYVRPNGKPPAWGREGEDFIAEGPDLVAREQMYVSACSLCSECHDAAQNGGDGLW